MSDIEGQAFSLGFNLEDKNRVGSATHYKFVKNDNAKHQLTIIHNDEYNVVSISYIGERKWFKPEINAVGFDLRNHIQV